MTPERRAELEATLEKMHRLSESVYWALFREEIGSECHAFLEHVGLMREFINVCRHSLARGIDYAYANGHGEGELAVQPCQLAYLREKLECIYGPGIAELLSEARRA